ncbi:hypothetical protein A8C32_12805 [Flavivirga aquatica]|uniref:YCII-related domain-containing protein n=1 Tax=Flavivirga aquatica TaxID=1849968 RepID=A0A1E5TE08_9FLAO|nr:YciI family protein [Flavivirga aquatica]OEK09577.1 hypothetical protein A8C32_12805 [Flavivirga aquatica]
MKTSFLSFLILLLFLACKEESKEPILESKVVFKEVLEKSLDTIIREEVESPIKKSVFELKQNLTRKGFKVLDYVDEKTKDTVLMQQYFIVFLKKGDIRGQNEEETAILQKEHLAHLTKMYELGYADISGPFGDDGDIRGITIYNVPTLKIADSLANSDPMVKSGRLHVEVHPWWAEKGMPLR